MPMLASNVQLAANEMLSFQMQPTQGSSGYERAESSFDMLLQKELNGATDGQKDRHIDIHSQQNDSSSASKADEVRSSTEEAHSRAEDSSSVHDERKTDESLAQKSSESAERGKDTENEDKIAVYKESTPVEKIGEEVKNQTGLLAEKEKISLESEEKGETQIQAENVLGGIADTLVAETSEKTEVQAEENTGDLQAIAEENLVKTEQSVRSEQETVKMQEVAQNAQDPARAVLQDVPAISVKDLRTAREEGSNESGLQTTVQIDKNGNAEMTVNLSAHAAQNGKIDGTAGKTAAQFSTMLSQEIKANANEFVKTGSIVLRDNNMGSINMILHPEELGNVKIHLELADKVITGKIMVESLEAYNAFKSNLQTLKNAFAENGLSTAGFELSWSGSDGNNHDGQGKQRDDNPNGRFYSDMIPTIATETTNGFSTNAYGYAAINVIA